MPHGHRRQHSLRRKTTEVRSTVQQMLCTSFCSCLKSRVKGQGSDVPALLERPTRYRSWMCDINRWVACMPRMFAPAGEEFGEEERVKHEEKDDLNDTVRGKKWL